MHGILGGLGALIVGMIVVLITWGVVWMRLYGMRRLRPEFAVLSILPQAIYYVVKYIGEKSLEPFFTPAVQNLYFLTWVAAMGVIIFTLRPGYHDDRLPVRHDPMFIMMSILTIAYGITTWANYAGELFSI